jgi:hypothetical protein
LELWLYLLELKTGFIKREQGVERMLTILNFLNTQADRFHGAFPHWMNGTNGNVIPFSQYDDGGDLVETSFMIQGLLTARQYFDQSTSEEDEIRNLITQIWEQLNGIGIDVHRLVIFFIGTGLQTMAGR